MELGDFLKAALAKRRRAGVHDCCTFPAEWALANGWPDPMAAWRGAYADEEDGARFIEDAGGLARLFAQGMAAANIPAADKPSEGCIGVVRVKGDEAGAIFTGKRWAIVAERGIACVSIGAVDLISLWDVHG